MNDTRRDDSSQGKGETEVKEEEKGAKDKVDKYVGAAETNDAQMKENCKDNNETRVKDKKEFMDLYPQKISSKSI